MAFIDDRIDRCKERIVAYENAIDAILLQGVAQYTLTTGQTTQQVTKLNLASIEKMLALCYDQLVTLEARRDGASSYLRGGW